MLRTSLVFTAISGFVFAVSAPAHAQGEYTWTGKYQYGDEKIKMFQTADQEIDAATAKARTAIKNCDENSFENAIDWLDDIAWDVSKAKEDHIDKTIDDLYVAWNLAAGCGEDVKTYNKVYAIQAGIDYKRINIIDSPVYLGKENGGVINTLGLLKPKDSGNFWQAASEFRYNLARAPNVKFLPNWWDARSKFWDLFFGVMLGRGKINDHFTDVGTDGDTLLIPGTGMGANGAGFSLAFAGGANTISQADYHSEYNTNGFWLGTGKTVRRNSVKLRTFGGVDYSHISSEQMFSGSIPGFARDFTYNTNVDAYSVGPKIGIEAGYRPDWSAKLSSTPIELFGKASYKLGYTDAEGSDSLFFTGFGTQKVDLDEKGFTHDFSVKAGITLNPDGPLSATFSGGYERAGNIPVVTRDGVGESNLDLESSNNFILGLGIQYSF